MALCGLRTSSPPSVLKFLPFFMSAGFHQRPVLIPSDAQGGPPLVTWGLAGPFCTAVAGMEPHGVP